MGGGESMEVIQPSPAVFGEWGFAELPAQRAMVLAILIGWTFLGERLRPQSMRGRNRGGPFPHSYCVDSPARLHLFGATEERKLLSGNASGGNRLLCPVLKCRKGLHAHILPGVFE